MKQQLAWATFSVKRNWREIIEKKKKEVQYNKPTKIEELSDQLIPVPEPGNLTSYLPLSAAPEIS